MVSRKEAQAASLVYVVAAVVLMFIDVSPERVGLMPGASWVSRLTYHFFHANIWHCLVNCWCLLSIVFVYDVNLRMLLTATAVAALFPMNALAFLYAGTLPTVGLSGICYALLGRITFNVARRWYYTGWMAVFIAVGFFFPNANAWLHLWCYLMGLLLAFLNKPIGR